LKAAASQPISSCFVSKFCFATCVFFPFLGERKTCWHSGFVEAALKILLVCQLAFGIDLASAWLGLACYSSLLKLVQAFGHGNREFRSPH